jgi:hypothetical protein
MITDEKNPLVEQLCAVVVGKVAKLKLPDVKGYLHINGDNSQITALNNEYMCRYLQKLSLEEYREFFPEEYERSYGSATDVRLAQAKRDVLFSIIEQTGAMVAGLEQLKIVKKGIVVSALLTKELEDNLLLYQKLFGEEGLLIIDKVALATAEDIERQAGEVVARLFPHTSKLLVKRGSGVSFASKLAEVVDEHEEIKIPISSSPEDEVIKDLAEVGSLSKDETAAPPPKKIMIPVNRKGRKELEKFAYDNSDEFKFLLRQAKVNSLEEIAAKAPEYGMLYLIASCKSSIMGMLFVLTKDILERGRSSEEYSVLKVKKILDFLNKHASEYFERFMLPQFDDQKEHEFISNLRKASVDEVKSTLSAEMAARW